MNVQQNDEQRHLILLGPQPEYMSLRRVLEKLWLDRPVALNTSGWQTDEFDDAELQRAVDGPCINLNLFARSEKLFADDLDLIQTLRARQDELRHLRDVYNERLDHLLDAAQRIVQRSDSPIDLNPECESAIEMVRQLDQEYFARTGDIVRKYEERLQTASRPHVIEHRRELAEIMGGVGLLLIAGGHVAIIQNRLKIFGVLEMQPQLPIIAWSGGAMALADQIVFFHDSPPQGPGNAELLRAGMGLYRGLLPLPDADSRLNLNDQTRVELFSRRFHQHRCVILDQQTVMERTDGNWNAWGQARQLGEAGNVLEFAS